MMLLESDIISMML